MNFNTSNIWEGLFIEITGDSLKKKVISGNLYRPPNNILANYRQFIEELNTQIENLTNNNQELILTGDLNIDLLQMNNKNIIDEFFDNIISHCLYPAITLPTRFSTSNCTLIDNIFCKLSQVTIKSIAANLINQFSDHHPYFLFLDLSKHRNICPKTVKIYTETEKTISDFSNEVHTSLTNNTFKTDPLCNPNANYEILESIINHARHLPHRYVKYDKHKHKKANG